MGVIVRLCAKDGEVLYAFGLRPGNHLDYKMLNGKIDGKKVERIVADYYENKMERL